MTVTALPCHPVFCAVGARARAVRTFRTSGTPTAQLLRFAVMGGLANGLYLMVFLIGTACGANSQVLNAIGTVSSTVLANELHRRFTFRAAGRRNALAVQLAGGGTAAAGLAASTAALAGYQMALPQGPSWGAAAVGMTVSAAVGLVRFFVLRAVSARAASGVRTRTPGRERQWPRPAGRAPSIALGQRRVPTRVAGALVVALLATWPLGSGICAASTLADGGRTPTQPTATDAGSGPSPPTGDPAARDVVVSARDAFAAGGSSGTLAVHVTDRAGVSPEGTTADGGARAPARYEAGWLADRRFPTASLVKLFLAEGILHQARRTGGPLSPTDDALLHAMLSRSDDDAASQLWVNYDGPALVESVARRYGLTSTAPPDRPGAWGQTTTSARDLGQFLGTLFQHAHPEDVTRLLGSLAQVTPIGADGFDQRFGLLSAGAAPPGTPVKQGWMCCVDDARHLHSVGLVGDRVVVLLVQAPAAADWPQLRADLDAAAVAALTR